MFTQLAKNKCKLHKTFYSPAQPVLNGNKNKVKKKKRRRLRKKSKSNNNVTKDLKSKNAVKPKRQKKLDSNAAPQIALSQSLKETFKWSQQSQQSLKMSQQSQDEFFDSQELNDFALDLDVISTPIKALSLTQSIPLPLSQRTPTPISTSDSSALAKVYQVEKNIRLALGAAALASKDGAKLESNGNFLLARSLMTQALTEVDRCKAVLLRESQVCTL